MAQLTQSISRFALKPGEDEIKKKDGGNSGGNDTMRSKFLILMLIIALW